MGPSGKLASLPMFWNVLQELISKCMYVYQIEFKLQILVLNAFMFVMDVRFVTYNVTDEVTQ